jgi:Mn-containing catalase
VIGEGAEALEEDGDENMLDIGIIGAGRRVEHYEMAGYATAIDLAKQLGNTKVVSLLSESLGEEKAADEKLHKIAQQLLKQAPTQETSKKMSASAISSHRGITRAT